MYYNGFNAIQAEERAGEGVNFRYYFEEKDKTCDGDHLLNFDGDYTWCLQQEGRQDAKLALEIGQDQIRLHMQEWYADPNL